MSKVYAGIGSRRLYEISRDVDRLNDIPHTLIREAISIANRLIAERDEARECLNDISEEYREEKKRRIYLEIGLGQIECNNAGLIEPAALVVMACDLRALLEGGDA